VPENLDALAKICLPPYDRTILRRLFSGNNIAFYRSRGQQKNTVRSIRWRLQDANIKAGANKPNTVQSSKVAFAK
jgi:hypothetical protein